MATAASPRRMPPAERRAQIVAAALEHFAAHPEEEVGLEDLAAAAGVTRNLLYRYFESKSDLHHEAVLEAVRRLAVLMDTDQSRPLSRKLPRNIAMWVEAAAGDDPAMRIVLRAGSSQDPAVAQVARAAREALARAIAFNHLGTRDPSPAVLAALDGYLALAERLIGRWREGDLDRAQLERVLGDVLRPLVGAVGEAR